MEKTPLHYLGFIYVGYAELTDNEFTDDEHAKVIELISDCDARGDIEQSDLAIAIADIMMWYEGIKDRDEREKVFLDVLNHVNVQDWFDIKYKEKYVKRLYELMLADGIIKESEKNWLARIGEIWGVKNVVESLLA